jgi:hypothetical protein
MKEIRALVADMGKQIIGVNPSITEDFESFCPLEEIKPSPVTERYRNKCEFTIGESIDLVKLLCFCINLSYRKTQ